MKKIYLLSLILFIYLGCTSSYSQSNINNNGWDWNGIIGTGQSLSVGAQGKVTTTGQPYHNLKLSLGNVTIPPWDANSSELQMVPLTEPIRPRATGFPSAYPCNIYGETFHSMMANQITALVLASGGTDYITAHTVVGESGQGMSMIKKGAVDKGNTGRSYLATLFEVKAIARLAKAAGKTYGIGAIVITHGETDAGNSLYENQLYQLWKDYNTDLPPLTGQTRRIPMFVSQQHAYPNGLNQRSVATLAQWQIGISHPGDIICSGPKYQYEYANDSIHLTKFGYHQLGEKLGEIYYHKVILGQEWQPLQPLRAVREGRVITVRFHVPVPPLAWDDSLPAPHQDALTEWAQGRGFEVRSGNRRVDISSVVIDGDKVRITCGQDLPADVVTVGYAMTTDGMPLPGYANRSGQLRDSDPFIGRATKSAQPNYCVAFEMPVH